MSHQTLPTSSLAMRARHGRRGFTFVELCLALVVSAIMLSALATFTLAVGNYWRQSTGTQTAALTANQAIMRIQKRLYDAHRLGYCRAGSAGSPAAVVYWAADTNGDGYMQFTELRVLAHNPTDKTVDLYVPVLSGGASDDAWSSAEFNAASAVNRLTTGQTPTPIVSRVSDATFATEQATSATLFPTFQFWLQIEQADGTSSNEYGAATLRSASTPP
jgi:prepilin-type N-terminal cleavage/methylation domain-containing protein